MAKDGKEYVAFVADRLVRYIETPAEERRRMRRDARSRREPFLARWFGWALYGWLMQLRARRAAGASAAEETAANAAAVETSAVEPAAEPAAET
jgi:hypothetical protein